MLLFLTPPPLCVCVSPDLVRQAVPGGWYRFVVRQKYFWLAGDWLLTRGRIQTHNRLHRGGGQGEGLCKEDGFCIPGPTMVNC